MMYATAEQFAEWYPNAPADAYDRHGWNAQKYMDNATNTVDGVKKLQIAFPTDEDDAEAVARCFCAIVNALAEVEQAKAAVGFTETENGIRPNAIRSVSAGSESISYDAGASDLMKAAGSTSALKAYIGEIVEEYLRGIADDNGVNLLYGGRYPNV